MGNIFEVGEIFVFSINWSVIIATSAVVVNVIFAVIEIGIDVIVFLQLFYVLKYIFINFFYMNDQLPLRDLPRPLVVPRLPRFLHRSRPSLFSFRSFLRCPARFHHFQPRYPIHFRQ